MGLQDKPDRRNTQEIKHEGLCNNIERKRSSQLMAR